MARKASVIVSVDLQMDSAQVNAICESIPGEGTQSQKVGQAALGFLEQAAEGGMMLAPLTVRKMQDCLGRPLEQQDVLEQFEAGTHRKDGQLQITIPIDPVVEPVYRDAASFNGYTSVEQYFRSLVDTANDQGWFHQIQPTPARVLMTQKDHKALVTLLGKEFENGTELAALIRAHDNDNAQGLFAGKD